MEQEIVTQPDECRNDLTLNEETKHSSQVYDIEKGKMLPSKGFENQSNYLCYMNAVTQCLMRIDADFSIYFYEERFPTYPNVTEQTLVRGFSSLMIEMGNTSMSQ
jgi:ubiquitin C-terminal hydrolase